MLSCTGKEERPSGRMSAGVGKADVAHVPVRRRRRAHPGQRGCGECHPCVGEEDARLGRRGHGGHGPCAREEVCALVQVDEAVAGAPVTKLEEHLRSEQTDLDVERKSNAMLIGVFWFFLFVVGRCADSYKVT